jgi:hypothetical protein
VAAHGVDASGTRLLVAGAYAVQSSDGLLLDGFHGDRIDLFVPCSLE